MYQFGRINRFVYERAEQTVYYFNNKTNLIQQYSDDRQLSNK